jgi:adenosine deaminase
METVEVANKLKGTRVVGVDLAGAEAMHPSSYYKNIFDLAKEYRLNITIHAGEATGSDEVMMALDNGATRIGHGVHLDTEKDGPRAKKEDICFEFCPTSNLQTKSLKRYEDVPIRDFQTKGIDITINSDNMTVSNTDVYKEFKHLYQTFKLNKKEVYGFLLNSVNHSFTTEEIKQKLRDRLDQKIDDFYSEICE